jgi:DnaK suppressor protein
VSSLTDLRADVLARLAALSTQHAELMTAAEGSNADDEHDPEGATLGWERQQMLALLEQARTALAEVDQALVRAADGSYGTCSGCGAPIGVERLEARPSATLCIACARDQAGGR